MNVRLCVMALVVAVGALGLRVDAAPLNAAATKARPAVYAAAQTGAPVQNVAWRRYAYRPYYGGYYRPYYRPYVRPYYYGGYYPRPYYYGGYPTPYTTGYRGLYGPGFGYGGGYGYGVGPGAYYW